MYISAFKCRGMMQVSGSVSPTLSSSLDSASVSFNILTRMTCFFDEEDNVTLVLVLQ